MRILAIRGRNLASLAGDFEVDFRGEPLASAGVFAISGPTGAGKSTLLDAMCLALYHDTPRLRSAKEAHIAVPDVQDQTLTPQDPRHLLRRGCGEGYAEVDFVDQDGVEWRARWSVARARSKIGGRLQQAQVSLLKLTDDQPFGGTVREVQERLVELTGLSFEQFCRSVLLAQNDFAALLKARQEERAGLLEALTGTSIFSQISKLAHQRNQAEQQQLKALEQQLGLHTPLSDEARAALQQQRDCTQELLQQITDQLQALQAEAAWHERGATLSEQLLQAQAQVHALEFALQADGALGLRLRQWAAAAAMRHWAQGFQTTEAESIKVQAGLPPLLQAQQAAAAAVHIAELASDRARAALAKAEQQRAEAQPQIKAARAADVQIELARVAERQSQSEVQRAAANETQIRQQIASVQREGTQHQSLVDEHRQWQQRFPHLPTEAESWTDMGHRLQSLLQLSQRHSETLDRQQRRRQTLAHDQSRLTAARLSLDSALALFEQCRTDVQKAEQALSAQDVQALAQRQRQWIDQDRAASHLQALLDAVTTAQQQHQLAKQRLDQATQQLQTLQTQTQTAAATLQQTESEELATRDALQRVGVIADAHTEQLRTLLISGEPCPVCGAREHPHAGQHSQDLQALLGTLAAQAESARVAHREAIAQHQHRLSSLRNAEQKLQDAGELQLAAQATLSRSSTELLSAAITIQPSWIDPATVSAALPDFQCQLDAEHAQLDQTQAEVERTQQSVTVARLAYEAAHGEWQKQHSGLEQLQAQLAPHQHALTVLEGELGAVTQDIAAALTQLRAANPGLTGPLADCRQWLADWQQGNTRRQAAATALQALRDLQQRLAGLQQQQASAAAAHDQAVAARERASAALQSAIAERHRLLAQADTEAHASALDQALAVAREQRDNCASEHSRALQQLTRTTGQMQAAAQLLAELQCQCKAQLQQLSDEWQSRLQADRLDPLPLDQLWTLLQALPADLSQQQHAWSARLQAIGDSQTRAKDLLSEQQQWQLQALSNQERSAVDLQLASAGAARDENLQQLGAIEQQLGEDARRRQAAAQQLLELQERRLLAQRWTVLDQLIGAADGSKFKRYAQQYTLEVLLEYANQHLARLAPRYRLRRGMEALSLLVIDSDLGDELRTVHSLSGGETFLVSLALALGLASLSSQRVRVESLFIDEGFGSLDAATLNTAMEALDRLQAEGRRVGVISHVHDMAERIGVQIRVEAVAPGKSQVRVDAAGGLC